MTSRWSRTTESDMQTGGIGVTCIVGLVHNDELTYMGGDAAASPPGGGSQTIIAQPKVFTVSNGDFLVGITGQPRLAQLMQFAFTPPEHEFGMSTAEYMATNFVDAMRRTVEKGGMEMSDHGQEVVDGGLLVAYRCRLFVVGNRFEILEAAAPFHAVGSGTRAALGALYATQGRDPFERVCAALDAAEFINTTVRRPFRVLCQQQHQQRRVVEVVDYTYSVEECPDSETQHTNTSAA